MKKQQQKKSKEQDRKIIMLEKLKAILSKNTGLQINEINESLNLKSDLGLSSFDLAELACIVEEEFDIEIPNRAINTFKTVGDVIKFIEKK